MIGSLIIIEAPPEGVVAVILAFVTIPESNDASVMCLTKHGCETEQATRAEVLSLAWMTPATSINLGGSHDLHVQMPKHSS